MKRSGGEPSTRHIRGGVIITLALAIAAVVLAVAAFQIDAFIGRAEAIDARLNLMRTTLDAEVGSFVSVSSAREPEAQYSADLAAVHESVAVLKTSRSKIETIRTDAAGLALPGLAPLGRTRTVRDALITRSDALAGFNETLLASAEFAVGRTQTLEAIARTLDTLQKLADEGVTIEQAEQLVKEVRVGFDATLEQMRTGSSSSPVLYSNTQVLQRLDELSAALAEIDAAIVARDQARIDAAFESYVALVDTDWLARLALNSGDGLQAIDAATRDDDGAAAEFAEAVDGADRMRQVLFLAALVAVIAALATGARAVMLREPGR